MSDKTEPDVSIIDKQASKREIIVNRIWFGYYAFNFIATFVVYIFTMVVAVPVLRTCYIVAVVVMILGTVLGLIQVIKQKNL